LQKYVLHRDVVREGCRAKASNPLAGGLDRQMLEERRRDAFAPVRIADSKGHLGCAFGERDIRADAGELR
jgi:hypothetical protein